MYVPGQQKAQGADFLKMGGPSSGIKAGGARFNAAPARLRFCPERPARATLHKNSPALRQGNFASPGYAAFRFINSRNPNVKTTPTGSASNPGAPTMDSTPAMTYVMPAIAAQEMA